MAAPQARSVLTYATAFVLGGSLIIAGSLSPWTQISGGVRTTAGVNFGEGQIILVLGVIAALFGAIAACNSLVWIEVLVAAVGCTLTSAVLSLALRQIHQIQAQQNILGFVSTTLAEGPWIVVAGGTVVGVASILCLGRALYRLSREDHALT